MNLTLPQLVAAAVGGILLFAAIEGKSPVEIVKGALTKSATEAPKKPVAPGPNVNIPAAARYRKQA